MIDKRIVVGGFAAGALIGTILIAGSRPGAAFSISDLNPDRAAVQPLGSPPPDQDAAFKRAMELGAQHNYIEAAQIIGPQALAGSARAQHFVGLMYWTGSGLPHDASKAVRWFTLAANQGNTASAKMLAIAYGYGNGVVRDLESSRYWLLRAANAGDSRAQLSTGLMYAEGAGVVADQQLAVYWLQRAAAQGDMEARQALARYSQPEPSPAALAALGNLSFGQLMQLGQFMRAMSGNPDSRDYQPYDPALAIGSAPSPHRGGSDGLYRGSSDARYEYDLSNPADRLNYSVDLDAQMRDSLSVDPRRNIDRSMGQNGGGIEPR